MRCEEFESRLNDLLDERRTVETDASLVAHAAQCASCAQLARDYESLVEGVIALPPVAAPADFSARVVAAWRTGDAQLDDDMAQVLPLAKVERRSRAGLVLALAATLLIAAWPAWSLLRPAGEGLVPGDGQPAGGNELAGQAIEKQATDAQPTEISIGSVAPRPALVDQAAEAYEPLLEATGESLAGALAALPSANQTSNGESDTGATVGQTAWDTGELASSFGPLTHSATRSVVALFRVLPGSDRAPGGQGVSQ